MRTKNATRDPKNQMKKSPPSIRDEGDSVVPPWLMADIEKVDPKGLEPLTSTMPLWRSPKLSYGPSCHPLIARNGRIRRDLRHGSAARLPDEFGLRAHRGRPPGFHPPWLATMMAYCFRSLPLNASSNC